MANREQIEFSFVSNNERYNVLLSPLEFNDWYLLCANSFSQSSKGLLRLELTLLVFFIVIVLIFPCCYRIGINLSRRAMRNYIKLYILIN